MENINKIRKSKVSGAATDEVYKPKWWLFPELSFLDPFITIRKGESSITPKNKASCEKLDSFGQIEKEDEVDIVDLLQDKLPTSDLYYMNAYQVTESEKRHDEGKNLVIEFLSK